ncbi:hypothetical protein, partial [Terrabacter terrae]|uniref:hypothetical protein n=1 Tax=Terrabacter terrae TaxID=318434 RepID=UPI0031E3A075
MRHAHETEPVRATPARDGPSPGIASRLARFGLHLAQMCAVMCVSLALLGLVTAGAGALLGFNDPRQNAPVLSAVIVTATLSLSMVAWMGFMAMDWRPTLEMAASTAVAGGVMILGYLMGLVSTRELVPGVCGLACLAMVVVMLPRFGTYASHSGR